MTKDVCDKMASRSAEPNKIFQIETSDRDCISAIDYGM